MKIIHKIGDVLASGSQDKVTLIPHCCNNIGAFGSGVAGAIAKKYPKAQNSYFKWSNDSYYLIGMQKIDFKLGEIQPVKVEENVYIINMIGQNKTVSKDNPKPIKYSAILECMEKVRDIYKLMKLVNPNIEICCPKFGSQLAGGSWELLEELVNEVWIENDIPVTVYSLES